MQRAINGDGPPSGRGVAARGRAGSIAFRHGESLIGAATDARHGE